MVRGQRSSAPELGAAVKDVRRQVREHLVCFFVAVAVEFSLRLRSLPATARTLGVRLGAGDAPTTTPSVLPWWTQTRLDAAVAVLRHWPVPPDKACLRRALVVAHRLRSLDPEVVIGVRRDQQLSAHAWVVVAGGSLDPSASAFTQLRLTS